MHILIVEDDTLQAEILKDKLQKSFPEVVIDAVLHNVKDSITYLSNEEHPDLILMDIILSDGSSFDIFEKVELDIPVIFTTAFDQYTLQAFKVHSIDYLLKPIDEVELTKAIEKYKSMQDKMQAFDKQVLEQLLRNLQKPKYKERFMVRSGQQINLIQTSDMLYAYAFEGASMILTSDGKKHVIDNGLEELQSTLDPKLFFRVNRKYLVHIEAIVRIYTWFNSRLKLELIHGKDHEVIVSRDRVTDFKQWLDQ